MYIFVFITPLHCTVVLDHMQVGSAGTWKRKQHDWHHHPQSACEDVHLFKSRHIQDCPWIYRFYDFEFICLKIIEFSEFLEFLTTVGEHQSLGFWSQRQQFASNQPYHWGGGGPSESIFIEFLFCCLLHLIYKWVNFYWIFILAFDCQVSNFSLNLFIAFYCLFLPSDEISI